MLVHDDVIMVTEKDESHYHEMIVHVALNTHPRPERVLVIGGGDGGTMREVMRHPEVGRPICAKSTARWSESAENTFRIGAELR